jgi:hypothetical protein
MFVGVEIVGARRLTLETSVVCNLASIYGAVLKGAPPSALRYGLGTPSQRRDSAGAEAAGFSSSRHSSLLPSPYCVAILSEGWRSTVQEVTAPPTSNPSKYSLRKASRRNNTRPSVDDKFSEALADGDLPTTRNRSSSRASKMWGRSGNKAAAASPKPQVRVRHSPQQQQTFCQDDSATPDWRYRMMFKVALTEEDAAIAALPLNRQVDISEKPPSAVVHLVVLHRSWELGAGDGSVIGIAKLLIPLRPPPKRRDSASFASASSSADDGASSSKESGASRSPAPDDEDGSDEPVIWLPLSSFLNIGDDAAAAEEAGEATAELGVRLHWLRPAELAEGVVRQQSESGQQAGTANEATTAAPATDAIPVTAPAPPPLSASAKGTEPGSTAPPTGPAPISLEEWQETVTAQHKTISRLHLPRLGDRLAAAERAARRKRIEKGLRRQESGGSKRGSKRKGSRRQNKGSRRGGSSRKKGGLGSSRANGAGHRGGSGRGLKRAPAGSAAFGKKGAGGDSDGSESYSSDDSDVDIVKEEGEGKAAAARVLDMLDETQVDERSPTYSLPHSHTHLLARSLLTCSLNLQ